MPATRIFPADSPRVASSPGDEATAFVDHHIVAVIEELERQHLLDETAIIVSADECIHRIPLIISRPGVSAGTVGEGLLANIDLAPMLCDLLLIPSPKEWEGASFA